MKQEFSSVFFEKDQHLADKPYIFYEDEERRSNLVRGRKLSPLFFTLFVLPLIFLYLFFHAGTSDKFFKIGLLLFLELSTRLFDLWIKRSFDQPKVILVWLVQIPIVFLIFFSPYISFWRVKTQMRIQPYEMHHRQLNGGAAFLIRLNK